MCVCVCDAILSVDRTDHQWTGAPTEKRLTGAGASWGQSPTMSAANYPVQVDLPVAVYPTHCMQSIVINNLIFISGSTTVVVHALAVLSFCIMQASARMFSFILCTGVLFLVFICCLDNQ